MQHATRNLQHATCQIDGPLEERKVAHLISPRDPLTLERVREVMEIKSLRAVPIVLRLRNH